MQRIWVPRAAIEVAVLSSAQIMEFPILRVKSEEAVSIDKMTEQFLNSPLELSVPLEEIEGIDSVGGELTANLAARTPIDARQL